MRAARGGRERKRFFEIIERIDREAREHSRDQRWRRTCAAELRAAEAFMAERPASDPATPDPLGSAGERVEYEPGTLVERAASAYRADQNRKAAAALRGEIEASRVLPSDAGVRLPE